MNFNEVVNKIEDARILNPQSFEVSGLCIDSRKATPDCIFFAMKGTKLDGEKFINGAIAKGAKAIVVSESFSEKLKDVTIIKTSNIQETLNFIIGLFYKDKLPENIYGVTGTNGKTSVANFTAHILSKLEKNSASMGTLGTLISGGGNKKFSESGMTTPDIISLYEDLAALRKNNINEVVMEVSSHGLHQGRLGGLRFTAAGFTNFTQDHLDYHGTMEEYFSAKMLLLSNYLSDKGCAVVNSDIPELNKIRKYAPKIFEYGKNAKDLKIKNIILQEAGVELELEYNNISKAIKTHLIGEFQAYNLACSIGLLLTQNYDFEKICDAANGINSVKGRMELIPLLNGKAKAIIDYAHTPDALEKAIKSARKHTSGKLILVFGCGGDRDKTKRPLMGAISKQLADVTIITDDNPRTEDADTIRKEISSENKKALNIASREDAIKEGLKLLKEGDSLLIAGKGHEDYQIVGNEKFHFSDQETVLKLSKNL